MKTKRDEPLEEIWAARRRIAGRFGSDPRKQLLHLRKRQAQAKARLYRQEDALVRPM